MPHWRSVNYQLPRTISRPVPRSRSWLLVGHAWLICLCLCLGLTPALAAKGPNSACLECHSDKTLSKTNSAGKPVSLFVDEAKFALGVHKTNTCSSCHADL